MQISAVSAFNFLGKGSKFEPKAGPGEQILYDEGQAYIAKMPKGAKKDTFVRSSREERSASEKFDSVEEAMAAGEPGFRPEDFRY